MERERGEGGGTRRLVRQVGVGVGGGGGGKTPRRDFVSIGNSHTHKKNPSLFFPVLPILCN